MLSHPVLADLIEQEFVPCVINNRGDRGSLGENDATLQLFGEPMLNNPVVRFVDSAGEVSAAVDSPRSQRSEALLIRTALCVCVRTAQAVAPRLSNQWTPAAVFRGIHAALTAVGRPLPAWAESMVAPSVVGTAVFTMG